MSVLALVIGLVVGAVAMWMVTRTRRRSVVATPAPTESPVVAAADPVPTVPAANGELEQLRQALDALPVGVVYADPGGRVVVRNSMAEHAAGARHGDILVEEAVESLLGSAAAGHERRQTLELFGPPARVLALQAQPVSSGGTIATIIDVTERARLDAVRTDFVANISHELKTPVGALSILAETLADADDPEVVERLSGKIVKEADRLAHTIDDLLELSRIELGGDAIRDVVPVAPLLQDAADRIRGLADRRRIRVVVIEPTTRLSVIGDRRQLVSAVGNLVDNAVKYSEPDSDIEIFAEPDVASGQIALSVTDHGMGIAAQHLGRIFERFYRVDKARSRDTGGVGLGLAIVRHVAANHGGEVNVTSQEGEGSTFTLKIPAAAGCLPVAEVTDEHRAAG
jgi:two-component system sensor histidine kinase SenX3